MNRSDLVVRLAERFSHLSLRDAEVAVTTILKAMGDAMAQGRRIEVRGFGSLTVKYQAPRIGRNPRSGESVAIAEKRVTYFKPGKALRSQVAQQTDKSADVQDPLS